MVWTKHLNRPCVGAQGETLLLPVLPPKWFLGAKGLQQKGQDQLGSQQFLFIEHKHKTNNISEGQWVESIK